MINKLINTFHPDKNNEIDYLDRDNFIHEVAHLVTLLGLKKTKKHLVKCYKNNKGWKVNKLIKQKLDSFDARDYNEIETTALTILIMNHLGGLGDAECLNDMVDNVKFIALKNSAIVICNELMATERFQTKAKKLTNMLLDLQNNLTTKQK